MNKKKIIQIGIIIFVIVFVTICVAIVQFSKHNLEEAKKEIEEYLEKAKNKVCGEYIYAYPPGSPIIAPGEIISDKFVYQIKKLYESGVNILSDSNLLPLKILTKK